VCAPPAASVERRRCAHKRHTTLEDQCSSSPLADTTDTGTRFATRTRVGMTSTARRVVGDFLIFASGVLILLFALVVMDDRFRQQISMSMSSAGDLVGVGRQVNDLALVAALIVTQFAREQVAEHVHMAVFTTAAVVLVIFLSRL
jgi:hypothetical protein